MRVDETNAAIRGFTDVRTLRLDVDPRSGRCDLALRLERPGEADTAIDVVLVDVAGLTVRDLGGGLPQLLLLTVEDISMEQRDRANYRIRELERGSIECVCRAIDVCAAS